MVKILKASRPLNLIILFLTQFFTVYFLGFGNSLAVAFDKLHLAIYVTTTLCSIFGYLFNDYVDINTDSINRPYSNYFSNPKLRNVGLLVAMISAILAVVYGFFITYKLGVIISIIVCALFIYSLIFKKLPLIGNLLIAILGAFSLIIFILFDPNLNHDLILIFSINAFAIHFIREIIKDAEDIEGDTYARYKTFPILAGIKATKILLIIIVFLFIMEFSTCVRLMMMRYFTNPLNYVFLIYNVVCIGFPLFYLLTKIQLAIDKNDFKYLNKVALYIMVTGSLSMLFF